MVLWKNDKIATGKNTTWAETEIWPRARGKLLTSGLEAGRWRGGPQESGQAAVARLLLAGSNDEVEGTRSTHGRPAAARCRRTEAAVELGAWATPEAQEHRDDEGGAGVMRRKQKQRPTAGAHIPGGGGRDQGT